MDAARKMVLINDLKPLKMNGEFVSSFFIHGNRRTNMVEEILSASLQTELKTLIYRVQRELPQGEWRVVENFKISGTRSTQYKPTTLQYKMTIIGDTEFRSSDYRNDNHSLSLASYEEIVNGKLKPCFLIAVMCQVIDLGEITTCELANGENRKRVSFRLHDTSGSELACYLWGQYAKQIESHMEESKDETIICLIHLAKIDNFRGEVQITNSFEASLLMLNPTMEEAIDFRHKMSQVDLPLALLDKSDEKKIMKQDMHDWNKVDIKCISEILLADKVESCKIICTIEAIDTDWGWFYFRCNRHNRRATKVGRNGSLKMPETSKPLFYCDRYKLRVVVKDDTGSCELMLLDSVARTIIGDKAVELWDGSYAEIEELEIIPIPIKSLVGKSFCFGLPITTNNVINGSTSFKVSEVWSGDQFHRLESLSEPVSLIETSSSTLSTSEVCLSDHNKEISSEDVSTPFSKHKEGDAELNDMNFTSKNLCAKNIKMEKTKED